MATRLESAAPASQATGGTLAALGVAGGVGTLLASSCCVLPLALGGLGVSAGLVTFLETLAPWRMPLLALSALVVAGGWLMWWRSNRTVCEAAAACPSPRGSRATIVLLAAATKLVAIAAVWSYFEPTILELLQGG